MICDHCGIDDLHVARISFGGVEYHLCLRFRPDGHECCYHAVMSGEEIGARKTPSTGRVPGPFLATLHAAHIERTRTVVKGARCQRD